MHKELSRLATYAKWPQNTEIQSCSLARQGFFYSGEGDKVVCSFCSIALDHWKKNENPAEKHRILSPQCEFVKDGTATELHVKQILVPTRRVTTPDGSSLMPNNSLVPETGSSQLDSLYASVFNRAERKGLISNGNALKEELDYERLRSEAVRYNTFVGWPRGAHADPKALAREGLFYTGQGDKVQCVFCRGSISQWEPTDQPATEHRRLYPQCPFVLGRDVGNVPNPSDSTTDSAGPTTNQLIAESSAIQSEARICNTGLLEQPKFPQYFRLCDRINSFTGKTVPQGQTVNRLAEAGWFHVGPGDKVRCFHCGGNLRDWEAGDDAWEEHKRWYKDCAHLINQVLPTRPKIQATMSEAVKYRIEPREIKARMDTPSVRAILNLGYELSIVRQVIETQLMNTGDDFPNAEAILEAIFALKDPVPSLQSASSSSSSSSFSSSSSSSSSTSPIYISDHAATSDGTSSQRIARSLAPEASFSLSPESASSIIPSASQSSAPQSLSSALNSTKPMSKIQSFVANISRRSSDSSPAASNSNTTSNQSQQASQLEEQSKSKGKRKKNKKKNSSAEAASAVEKPKIADVQSQTSPNKNALKQEEIVQDRETLEYLEENRRLLEARTCKVCMDAEVNTVFLPCGHLVCCHTCAPLLKDCPICRTFVRGTVKTFLS